MEWSLVAVRCRLLLGVDTQWMVLELLLRCCKGDGAKRLEIAFGCGGGPLFPEITSKEQKMKKYLVATALIVSFAAPAFAEEIYVAFDPASHKCTMMHSQPTAPMKSMGSFKSEAEAKTAMAKMKECEG